ncbi:hypothetical protein SAY86_007324 [Trapa natans]|uniref:Auxin-responsive protein n=1 Tax=Trapa natans TaxID=22666 RepID=A0AAN7LL44_TRANT|nr:hypothetical protein SAY86_007324 [Trapa natans]
MDSVDLEATELRLGLPGTSWEKQIRSSLPEATRGRWMNHPWREAAAAAHPMVPKRMTVSGAPFLLPPNSGVAPYQILPEEQPSASKLSRICVKVSMDGAPYLRKIELGVYEGYRQLLTALEDMFKLSMGTYTMFRSSCKKLRIKKGAEEATGLTNSP